MVYPTESTLTKLISKDRMAAIVMFSINGKRIYKRKTKNITPDDFNKLSVTMDEIIKINTNPNLVVKFGIEEIQKQIEEFM